MTNGDPETMSLGANHRLLHAPDMDAIKYQSRRPGKGWHTQANLGYTEAMGIAAFMATLRERHDIPDWKLERRRVERDEEDAEDDETVVAGMFDPETKTIYINPDAHRGEPEEDDDAPDDA